MTSETSPGRSVRDGDPGTDDGKPDREGYHGRKLFGSYAAN